MRSVKLYQWFVIAIAIIALAPIVYGCATGVDAAAVVSDACSYDVTDISVDVSMTGTVRTGDESYPIRMEWLFNDGNSIWIQYNPDNSVEFEVMVVDSSIYVRERGANRVLGAWEDHTRPGSGSSTAGGTSGGAGGASGGSTVRSAQDTAPPTFCGMWPLSGVDYVGTTTIGDDNISVRHFRISVDQADVRGGPGSYETYQYWIDSSGKVLQASKEYLEADRDKHGSFVATYSDYGVANVITAPVIPQE